jgi:hypothetical protein
VGQEKRKQKMSGGFFDYQEHRISDISDSIEQVILKNKKEKAKEDLYPWDYDENGKLYEYSRFYYGFNDETIERFKEAVDLLKRAEIYVHRIDYLLSSDDGEQTFHERLKRDLEKLEKTNKI